MVVLVRVRITCLSAALPPPSQPAQPAGSRVIGSGLFFGVRDGNGKRKTGIRGDRLEFRSFLFF